MMGKKCIKCGYERQPSDLTPEYECPECGIIYAKAEAILQNQRSKKKAPEKVSIDHVNKESHLFFFPTLGFFGSLLSLTFLLPERLKLEAKPIELPPAPFGLRIWATISTFFHMIFMGLMLRDFASLMANLYLRLTGQYFTIDIIGGPVSGNFGTQTKNLATAINRDSM